MQCRIPTLVTVSVAAVLGAAFGLSLTAVTHGGLQAMIGPDTLASAAMTACALFTIRRWLAGFDKRNCAALAELGVQQRALEAQRDLNMAQLNARSAEVVKQGNTAEEKLRAMNGRLDALAEARAADQRELEVLRAERKELLKEYNALVLETLQSGSDRFTGPVGRQLIAAVETLPDQRGPAFYPGDTTAPH